MSKKTTLILGIETSCDDTSLALLEDRGDGKSNILAHKSLSQEELLQEWGGVVPELAARNHLKALPIILNLVLAEAKKNIKDIDLIGVTALPGLLGPLLTGLNTAKDLSMLYKIPIVGVNHLFAHLQAIHLTESINYPFLGLLISGGHSLFFHVSGPSDFKVIGSTIDDAAGEAFDKGGKILGLKYPAGPIIDKLAKEGDENAYEFPVGLKNSKDARLSFSGIKTELRRKIESDPSLLANEQTVRNLCASYQKYIVEALVLKTKFALKHMPPNSPIVVGGGVACNSKLRMEMSKNFKNVSFVKPEYCTDNGAMIAHFAYLNQDQKINYPDTLKIDAKSRFINKKDYR